MQSIFVAGEESEARKYLGATIHSCGYRLKFARQSERSAARIAMDSADACVLLLDFATLQQDGLLTLQELRRLRSDLPIIVFSTSDSPRDMLRALKQGASGFLAKPVNATDLQDAIGEVLSDQQNSSGSTAGDMLKRDNMLAAPDGPWSSKLETLLDRASFSSVPLLLRGETGVGKEVIARRFHLRSPRSRGPFLKLNCAALPSELVESELFGYERGAFTGAFKTTAGKFEMANGGTILLDEIGDMDVRLQAKLLQVIQDKEFLRIGSSELVRVDVRVMAATHRDLEACISQGTFREDLFYRLNVIDINIPALRDRVSEILPLAELFLRRHATAEMPSPEISLTLQRALLDHDWPGNIRELENVMQKFLVLRNADWIADELVSRSRTRKPAASARVAPPVNSRLIDLADAGTIRNALNTAQWDRAKAAKLLDMDRGALESRMKELAIQHGPVPVSVSTDDRTDGPSASILSDVDDARKAAESEAILTALNSSRWNRKQAAALLGIDYKALLYRMKKLGIGEKLDPGQSVQPPAADQPVAVPDKIRLNAG